MNLKSTYTKFGTDQWVEENIATNLLYFFVTTLDGPQIDSRCAVCVFDMLGLQL